MATFNIEKVPIAFKLKGSLATTNYYVNLKFILKFFYILNLIRFFQTKI